MIHTFECESGRFYKVDEWRDWPRAEKLTREIEKHWNLHQVAPSKEASYSAPTTGQCRRYFRQQKESADGKLNSPQPIVLRQLQTICTQALSEQKDLPSYISQLEQSGINVEIATKEGQPVGISYKLNGIPFAGRKLGRNFSWTGLKKQGMLTNLDVSSLHFHFREIDFEQDISPKIYTQNQIEKAASDQPDFKVFIGRLQAQDISVKFKVTRNKVIQGIRYGYMGEEWRASQLKDATLPKLQQIRRVNFNFKRDLELIKAVNTGKKIQLTPEQISTPKPTLDNSNEFTSLSKKLTSNSDNQPQPKPDDREKQQIELAEKFYYLAGEIFNQSPNKQEISPGVWSLEGQNYTLLYDRDIFSVMHRERGEILTAKIHNNQVKNISSNLNKRALEIFQAHLLQLHQQAELEAKSLAKQKPKTKQNKGFELD